MSCYLTLSAFNGDDMDAASKKLALMFRMAPGQAYAILEKISKGQIWQTPREVSDQQAAVAENYLTGIGFQVVRSDQEDMADPIAESVNLEEEDTFITEADTTTSLETAEEVLVPDVQQPSQKGLAVGFHGTGGGLFKIMLINWILTIITLGIYYFWGKTKVRRYLWEQSSYAGDRFYYHGTGGELFKGALIFGVILSLLNGASYALGQAWGAEAQLYAEIGTSYLILSLLPVIMVGAMRYRLSRTAWRGIRLSFRGKRKSALWLYIKGYLFTFLTLGLYWPFFSVQKQKFWKGNSYFGNQAFEYDGEGKAILKAYLLFWLAIIIMFSIPSVLLGFAGLEMEGASPEMMQETVQKTMMFSFGMLIPFAIVYLYYSAYLDRYHWSKTRFAGGDFKYDATGGQWFLLNFTNVLLLAFTAFLALPFVMIRNRKFLAAHLTVHGNMQLSQIIQEAQKSSALGEGAADGFDMDIDIGL
jgi:uncharacterized membrane protein YjgN (DUF898 family)